MPQTSKQVVALKGGRVIATYHDSAAVPGLTRTQVYKRIQSGRPHDGIILQWGKTNPRASHNGKCDPNNMTCPASWREVQEVDKSGRVLRTWPSVAVAAAYFGVAPSTLSGHAHGKRPYTISGRHWLQYRDMPRTEFREPDKRQHRRPRQLTRPVQEVDQQGYIRREWPSLARARKALGRDGAKLESHIVSDQPSIIGGMYYQYKDCPRSVYQAVSNTEDRYLDDPESYWPYIDFRGHWAGFFAGFPDRVQEAGDWITDRVFDVILTRRYDGSDPHRWIRDLCRQSMRLWLAGKRLPYKHDPNDAENEMVINMPSQLARVAELRSQGYGWTEVSKSMRISPRRLNQLQLRLRKWLEMWR